MTKVHKYKNVWWFWDESKKPRKRIGSYTSKVGAKKGLDDWLERIQNHSIKNDYNQLIIEELTHIKFIDSKCTCIDEIEGNQCSHCQEMKYNL